MPSTRRTVLAGAAAALAGCVGGDRDPGTNDGPTEPSPQAFGETATVGGAGVRLREATAQHSYVTLTHPDFADVVAADGQQYLFLTVEATGSPAPDASEFAAFGGEATYEARTSGSSGRPYREGAPYAPEEGEGWLLFELPAPLEGDRIGVAVDTGDGEAASWDLPDDVAASLRGPPPSFEVRAFEAPSVVRPEEPIEVSATVANVGEGAGTFRGSLNQEGDLLYGADTFSFDLEAGEERDWTEAVTTHQRTGVESEATVRLRFRSAGGDFDRDVLVRPPETTAG